MSKRKVTEFILFLNQRIQIFEQGIQSDGNSVESTNTTPGVYSPLTEALNEGKNFTVLGSGKQKIAGDRYFLFDTGKWFESFRVLVFQDRIEITAIATRGDKNMLQEYGSQLLGLTDENIDVLADFARVFFENDFRARFIR